MYRRIYITDLGDEVRYEKDRGHQRRNVNRNAKYVNFNATECRLGIKEHRTGFSFRVSFVF